MTHAYGTQNAAKLRTLAGSMDAPAKRHKFGAVKKCIDGHEFDSTWEAERYLQLKSLLAARVISDLKLQSRFVITDPAAKRPRYYVADFDYMTARGVRVVEDAKSKATRTALYLLKKRLVLELHGIMILEVYKDGSVK